MKRSEVMQQVEQGSLLHAQAVIGLKRQTNGSVCKCGMLGMTCKLHKKMNDMSMSIGDVDNPAWMMPVFKVGSRMWVWKSSLISLSIRKGQAAMTYN